MAQYSHWCLCIVSLFLWCSTLYVSKYLLIVIFLQLWRRCDPSRDDPCGVRIFLLHKYWYEHITATIFASVLTYLVGAALWAADIESQSNAMVKETAPNLRQVAEGVE